jgi:hypothetical protein
MELWIRFLFFMQHKLFDIFKISDRQVAGKSAYVLAGNVWRNDKITEEISTSELLRF